MTVAASERGPLALGAWRLKHCPRNSSWYSFANNPPIEESYRQWADQTLPLPGGRFHHATEEPTYGVTGWRSWRCCSGSSRVGLLGAVGWVHLHLWQEGYRHIPTIGPLFLAAAVTALVVGVGLLGRPSRLIGLLGFGTVIGILAGLIVSVNVGLFGFTESLTAPFAVESIVLETAAAVTLAAWIAVDLLAESRHSERAAHAPGAPAATAARIYDSAGGRR